MIPKLPMHGADTGSKGPLAEAFSAFVTASASLERSYRELQAEVAELSLALSERNHALSQSLSKNKTMGLTLQRILDAIPCGVLVVNGDGAIRLANPEAARLLGLAAAQIPSAEAAQGQALLHPGSAHDGDGAEQEICFESSAGRHWLAVRRVALPGIDEAGDAESGPQAVVTLEDISVRKRVEHEREASRDAVALAQVSALLAHEIRNPLASLELFAGLIADSPERRHEWISHLRAGIRSLSGTVNNVLILHGGGAPVMERFDLIPEARHAVDFLQPLAQQLRVTLRLEATPDPCWIRSNRSALQQLLLNLCTNALRHTPADGLVAVRCEQAREAGDAVRVAVADNGCGIAKEHLPRLFKCGFSGSGTTPGLGLAVCDRLMRQHGGAIRVESQPGHGSTFTLEFPSA